MHLTRFFVFSRRFYLVIFIIRAIIMIEEFAKNDYKHLFKIKINSTS